MEHIVAGLDIGNGYVKGVLKSDDDVYDEVDIPSGVTVMTRPNLLPVAGEGISDEIKEIYNRLDVSFVSELVDDPYRRLFGDRSLQASGASFEEFDVLGVRSKAEQSLSKVLVLGIVAAKGLQDYYRKNGVIPKEDEPLYVESVCALALPITEYMKHRKQFASDFKDKTHTVVVHNFEYPITVYVSFKDVQVLAEGASGLFAIVEKGEPLMNAMLKDVRSRGIALEGIEAKDVLAAQNTVGIDIGEGTVNFPVFSNGRFNPDASTTFNKGFGTVLMASLEAMEAQGLLGGFSSRKQLAAYLSKPPSPLRRNHYNRIASIVSEEVVFFARELTEKFGHILNDVGATVEVVYVYGGGSGPVKDVLYPMLIDKVSEVLGMDAFPVLYLDAGYSRHLNREGLFIAAKRLA